ncbi:MAG: NYN domain-containing protein [Bacteroidetes bacterium]|nr:NYN domain-containing protein [Bacteroidota bacterium]
MQQYGLHEKENSTDSNMIIDAMDILYSEKMMDFCIVSATVDFPISFSITVEGCS